mgnify:CR=1 FL=1
MTKIIHPLWKYGHTGFWPSQCYLERKRSESVSPVATTWDIRTSRRAHDSLERWCSYLCKLGKNHRYDTEWNILDDYIHETYASSTRHAWRVIQKLLSLSGERRLIFRGLVFDSFCCLISGLGSLSSNLRPTFVLRNYVDLPGPCGAE